MKILQFFFTLLFSLFFNFQDWCYGERGEKEERSRSEIITATRAEKNGKNPLSLAAIMDIKTCTVMHAIRKQGFVHNTTNIAVEKDQQEQNFHWHYWTAIYVLPSHLSLLFLLMLFHFFAFSLFFLIFFLLASSMRRRKKKEFFGAKAASDGRETRSKKMKRGFLAGFFLQSALI